MISSNSWSVTIAILIMTMSAPPAYAQLKQQLYGGYNTIILPATDGPSLPGIVVPPWWSPAFRYFSQPGNQAHTAPAATKEDTEVLRNGPVWIFRGDSSESVNCNFSAAQPPPKRIELPPDVCLYGTANNFTFLMNETVVCEDGNEAWLALYRDSTCHSIAWMINPKFVLPSNICLNTGVMPNATHVIFKLSMMFHCIDAVEGSMPDKLMNGDLDVPVIEDPPKKRDF